MCEIKKVQKVIEIALELYEMDPKYFVDCFFNMYYQMKKKAKVEEVCNGNVDDIRRTWGALNYFKTLSNDYNDGEKAQIAGNKYNVNSKTIISLLLSFKATRGVKNKKFSKLF